MALLRALLPLLVTDSRAASLAPELSVLKQNINEIAYLAVELGLAGVVATNTTVSRDDLATPGVDELGTGGISGPPLDRRSAEVLRRLYGRVGDRLVLISVGGIETADDAWDRITADASQLQGYTGFIYGGGYGPSTFTTESPSGCTTVVSRRWSTPSARRHADGAAPFTPVRGRCGCRLRWTATA